MKPCKTRMAAIISKVPGLFCLGFLSLSLIQGVSAQPNAGNARNMAPIDLSGNWVSLVTEHWRYRIVTAGPGEVSGYELTELGMRIAQNWDPAVDTANGEACKSYGAAGIMRQPTRLQIGCDE